MLKAVINKSNAIWTVNRLANRKALLLAPGPEDCPVTLLARSSLDIAAIIKWVPFFYGHPAKSLKPETLSFGNFHDLGGRIFLGTQSQHPFMSCGGAHEISDQAAAI